MSFESIANIQQQAIRHFDVLSLSKIENNRLHDEDMLKCTGLFNKKTSWDILLKYG